MNKKVRLVEENDIGPILDIYSYYILNTPITFETIVPSIDEFKNRINSISAIYPWIVYEDNTKVLGYAYASKHRERDAYQWSVDVSVYLDKDFTGKGIGRILYEKLLKMLKHLGYLNAYAGISLPNLASVGLHECFGFKQVAMYQKVGYKNNSWIDVGWWWKNINKTSLNPHKPENILNINRNELESLLE